MTDHRMTAEDRVKAAKGWSGKGAKQTHQWCAGLDHFVEETGVDELIVASAIYDHAARLRSYEILAETLRDSVKS